MINQFKNPTFGGFKPDAMQRIAGTLGYSGDMSGFQQYLANNPDKQAQMDQFKQAAMMMARGGSVQKFQVGGLNIEDKPEQQTTFDPVSGKNLTASQLANRMASPNLGGAYKTQKTDTGFEVLDETGKAVKTNLDTRQQAQDYAKQVTAGVTSDIQNIEQEYTNAQSNYTQQNLELQRLQEQAAANPDNQYLQELVESKGKEVSDTYSRMQQLQPLYQSTQKTIKDVMTERATDPTLPTGARVDQQRIQQNKGQFIEAGSGQVSGEFGVS